MIPWGAIGGALTLVVGKRNSTEVTAERHRTARLSQIHQAGVAN